VEIMSGGSYDYAYRKIEALASEIKSRAQTSERKAFADHLLKVAKAAHDIEWVDSCDYGVGDENKSIRECLGNGLILLQVVIEAKKIMKDIQSEIDRLPNAQDDRAGSKS
jgi:hypothetical protein